jgi:hypothetical protein
MIALYERLAAQQQSRDVKTRGSTGKIRRIQDALFAVLSRVVLYGITDPDDITPEHMHSSNA